MGDAERYNRPVVHGMMEGGPSQDQAIHKGHGYADGDTGFECPEHATRGRAVQVKFFTVPAIQGRNNKRLAVDTESDVSEKARIQNCINGVQVVRASARQATKSVRFVRFIFHVFVYGDPIHFLSLASVSVLVST